MKPKILPKRMERRRKRKIWLMVSTWTIREAKRQAKIPVAPSEKSIRPELRLVFKARAAIRVLVIVLSLIILFETLSLVEPMKNNPVSLRFDNRTAIKILTTGQKRDQKSFFPVLLSL